MGLGVQLAVVGALLAGVVFIADRFMAQARRQGRDASTRAWVGVFALVGGPLAWLLLWRLLRNRTSTAQA